MGAGDAVPAGLISVPNKKTLGNYEVKMNRAMQLWRAVLCGIVLSVGSAGVWAQAQKSAVPARVVQTVDDTKTVTLSGNVHPLARAAFDQGALPDSQPMTRMLLLLERSSAQEQSLKQLIDAQQTKNSGNYHAWLSPEQFGQQFGPADSDVQAVTDWLTRSGFQVANVTKGKDVIEFSGNVGQVRPHSTLRFTSSSSTAKSTSPTFPIPRSPKCSRLWLRAWPRFIISRSIRPS